MCLIHVGMLIGLFGQGQGNFLLPVPMTTLSIYTGNNTKSKVNFLKIAVTKVCGTVLFCRKNSDSGSFERVDTMEFKGTVEALAISKVS